MDAAWRWIWAAQKLAAAVVDGAGRILTRAKRPADRHDTAAQIAAIAEEVLRAAGMEWRSRERRRTDRPRDLFAGTGNVWAPNLFGLDELPLRAELRRASPVPLAIDSDRAGYVLGEQWLGAARGLADVVFLAVGTGIGAGILTGGRLCRGAGDIAGAVGWFALDSTHRPAYRHSGCWEWEAAGPGLARRAGTETAEQAVAAARRGEPAACRALEETARWLGRGAANLVSVLNPEMIVLGGGLMQGAGDLLLEPVRREMLEWAQPVAARQVRIELTRLGEDAGLLGAARLAAQYVG